MLGRTIVGRGYKSVDLNSVSVRGNLLGFVVFDNWKAVFQYGIPYYQFCSLSVPYGATRLQKP